MLVLEEKPNMSQYLRVTFQRNGLSRSLTLKDHPTEEEGPEQPTLKFEANFSLAAVDLKAMHQIFKAYSKAKHSAFSDYCTFALQDAEGFIITSENNGNATDFALSMSLFRPNKCQKHAMQQQVIYSLEYLQDILEGASLADIIFIGFSTDMPVRFDFLFKRAEWGRLRYYLAPRVEEEDEPPSGGHSMMDTIVEANNDDWDPDDDSGLDEEED